MCIYNRIQELAEPYGEPPFVCYIDHVEHGEFNDADFCRPCAERVRWWLGANRPLPVDTEQLKYMSLPPKPEWSDALQCEHDHAHDDLDCTLFQYLGCDTKVYLIERIDSVETDSYTWCEVCGTVLQSYPLGVEDELKEWESFLDREDFSVDSISPNGWMELVMLIESAGDPWSGAPPDSHADDRRLKSICKRILADARQTCLQSLS